MNVQQIRLADVFLIGPFLIYAGCKKELPSTVRDLLILIGTATILYNGIKYIQKSND